MVPQSSTKYSYWQWRLRHLQYLVLAMSLALQRTVVGNNLLVIFKILDMLMSPQSSSFTLVSNDALVICKDSCWKSCLVIFEILVLTMSPQSSSLYYCLSHIHSTVVGNGVLVFFKILDFPMSSQLLVILAVLVLVVVS